MKSLRKPVGAAILSLFVATGVVFLSQPIILTHAETATSDVNLNIGAVMGLSLDADSLDLSTTPHHFVSGTINATVSTNSQYGYTLTLEDMDSNTDLVHSNTAVSDSFSSSFSGSKTSSEMEDNTWGFSLNATDYFKVPANGSPVALKRTTDPMTAAVETVPVTFGAMVGNIVSGAYTDGVLFTMYTNGADGKPSDGTDPGDPGSNNCTGSFFCISEMQEMTTEICNTATTPLASATEFDWDGSKNGNANYVPRTILTDNRDGNRYLVSKLADGKCWMSQNLALDLGPGILLTNENTDLNQKPAWSTSEATWTAEQPYVNWSEYTAMSYHPVTSDRYSKGGWIISSTPTANTNEYRWEAVGNFYNWQAATANSPGAPGVAPDSICPKGWTLPQGGTSTAVGSFGNLMSVYNGTTSTNIMNAPLNFAHSTEFTSGRLKKYNSSDNANQWIAGALWSSTIDNQAWVYAMFLGSNPDSSGYVDIITNYSNSKDTGYNVRCIAR